MTSYNIKGFMNINKEIFRAYDIRGNSIKHLTEEVAYKIGFCFANMSITKDNNKICVGLDGRISSPTLCKALELGLTDSGAKIINIGVVPTPVLYFADKHLIPAGSIMVTGSHNPRDDNGFKMLQNGKSFFGTQIQSLLTKINGVQWPDHNLKSRWKIIPSWNEIKDKYTVDTLKAKGQLNSDSTQCIKKGCYMSSIEFDVLKVYIKRILEGININPKLKVAWDPGNGATCNVITELTKHLINKNIIINSKIDGNFPNHHPDPTNPANLQELIKLVKEQNCDIGIAFDGDGDRIGIISGVGKILFGDQIVCIFAEDILKAHPNANIIVDVKTSQFIVDKIKSFSGNTIICRTGHPFIKSKMLETNALLAGEMSGHIFFADKYFGFDDAIYAALRFLDLLSKSSKTLDKIIDELPKIYSTPEIKIFVTSRLKLQIIKEIKEKLLEDKIEFNDIDGVRVNTKNGWWLLRSSNTESIIVARAESVSQHGLKHIIAMMNKYLVKYDLLINY